MALCRAIQSDIAGSLKAMKLSKKAGDKVNLKKTFIFSNKKNLAVHVQKLFTYIVRQECLVQYHTFLTIESVKYIIYKNELEELIP